MHYQVFVADNIFLYDYVASLETKLDLIIHMQTIPKIYQAL